MNNRNVGNIGAIMKFTAVAAIAAVAITIAGFWIPQTNGNEITKGDEPVDKTGLKEAMFGAGCFWGVQATFDQVPGVKETAVGYSGGHVDDPSYKEVCYTETGHAEVVHIWYDPQEVSYTDLLKVFFAEHDPTQVNRQGPDVGDQYRSAVFYYDDTQRQEAETMKESLNTSGQYSRPIATSIEKADTFWMGEDYHQKYLEKRGLVQCHVK